MPSYAPWQEYAIAAGWNNTALLKTIESITPPSDRPFYPVNGYSSFNPGAIRIRGDGSIYLAGYPSCGWRFSAMTRKQYQYLMSTYTVGGNSYSGKVTIRTRKDDGTFANYNAVLLLPILPEVQRVLKLYRDVEIRFSRLVAI